MPETTPSIFFIKAARKNALPNPADLFGGSFGLLLREAATAPRGLRRTTVVASRKPNDPPIKSAGFEGEKGARRKRG
jgi:hypothetical protein